MEYLVVLAALAIAISLHELGHAFAMRQHGIPLQEITLFGIGKRLFTFRLRSFFGETPINIRLIPLGAYVAPTEEGAKLVKLLPYSKQAHVFGAGIIINLALFTFIEALREALHATPIWWFAGAALAVTIAFLVFNRILSAYMLPVMGPLLIYLILRSLLSGTVAPEEVIGGPVAVFDIFGTHVREHSDFIGFLSLTGLLSIAIGTTNMLPFYPLDGGHLFAGAVEKIVGKSRFVTVGKYLKPAMVVCGAALILTALGSDFLRVIR